MALASHVLELWPTRIWPGYLVAGAVAALVGVADILTRYKDNPLVALSTGAAAVYLAANAAFGLAAFWLAMVLDITQVAGTVAPSGGLTAETLKDGLMVGFGAIIVLRAIAFKLSVGGKAGEVGPSTIVDSLLATFDQSIDRTVAARKDKDVRAMMTGISFDKAKAFIPTYCLSLLEQDEDLAKRVGVLVNAIGDFRKADPGTDSQRAFLLGNTLINVFGYSIASAAVKGFRDQLLLEDAAEAPAKPPPPSPSPAPLPDGAAPAPSVKAKPGDDGEALAPHIAGGGKG